jgi:chromosome segregation protein
MKMEATQQNLLRIQDIIAEVKRQIITLERQVKRAEEYKAIRKEVKEIEIRFGLQEYAELSEKGRSCERLPQGASGKGDEDFHTDGREGSFSRRDETKKLGGGRKLRLLQQGVYELGQRIQKTESEVEFFKKVRASGEAPSPYAGEGARFLCRPTGIGLS